MERERFYPYSRANDKLYTPLAWITTPPHPLFLHTLVSVIIFWSSRWFRVPSLKSSSSRRIPTILWIVGYSLFRHSMTIWSILDRFWVKVKSKGYFQPPPMRAFET
jgi:hypothetical protein